jgi:hypothetical protein
MAWETGLSCPCRLWCRDSFSSYRLRGKYFQLSATTRVTSGVFCGMPVSTTGQNFDLIFPEGKCIEPIEESRSDYEIAGEIARKLGRYEEFTEGKTVEEWIKSGF